MREKPEKKIAVCPKCHAIKMYYKKRVNGWQTSIVYFDNLPKEVCPRCNIEIKLSTKNN